MSKVHCSPIFHRCWLSGMLVLMMLILAACTNAESQPPTEAAPLPAASETQPPTSPIPSPTAIPLETTFTDGFGTPMSLVPAGPFEMGSADGAADEMPIHTVMLDAFYIDLYEVTNSQFFACVDEGICDTPANTTSFDSSYSRQHYYGTIEYGGFPVIYVSWYDAQDYCQWRGARLPTEAEWEKAARGGLEGARYPWGDEAPVCESGAENGARFDDDADCNDIDTDQVGNYAPNGYGLFDMAGNLWEWVSDWYDDGYYANSPTSNPQGPQEGSFPVLRGGSWQDSADHIRVADRRFNDPKSGALMIGFRCARNVEP